MASCDKILNKAKRSPKNVTFEEVCKLAKCYGWIARTVGGGSSHAVFTHPELGNVPGSLMNFQRGKGGKAKTYQVRQLLDAIEDLD